MAFASQKITTANIQEVAAPTEGPAGSSIFVYNYSGTDVMYKYAMNAWQLSSAVDTGKSGTMNEGVPSGLTFKSDGLRLYCADRLSETVFQYSMFNPYDIQNAVFSGEIDTSSSQINVDGVMLSADGSWLFTVSQSGTDSDKVVGYQLSTAWDVRTASRNTARDFSFGVQVTAAGGAVFGDSGTKMYIVDTTNDRIAYYSLSTAYDPSSATFQSNLALTSTYTPYDLVFKPDGTRVYVYDNGANKVVEYSLSPAWTDTTPTEVTTLDVSANVGAAYAMYINETAYTESDEGSLADYNSNSIDVTSGGLEVSSVYDSDWGTGDFTVEAWIYATSLSGTWNGIFGHTYATGGGLFYAKGDGSLDWYEGGSRLNSGAGTITTGSWIHVAAVRSSGTLTFYKDGTSVASASYTRSITDTNFYLGENQNASEPFEGYITRAHATNHAKYTGNFTASSTYTADGNSLILLVTDGTNYRDISQAATITDNGASIQASHP